MIKLTGRIMSGAMLAASIAGLAIGQAVLQRAADAQGATVQAPRFVVDPLWPKPLPNNWVLGWTIGLWVDEQDYVWVIHRAGAGRLHNNEIGAELDPPIAECCRTAPPVLVFDPAGNLVRSWGGPSKDYEWPQQNHGIHVDYKGNVWIGANGEKDAQILKFTRDGRFQMQIGKPGMSKGRRRHPEPQPPRGRARGSRHQRALRRRRLRQPPRDRLRRGHRPLQAALRRQRPSAR